MPTVRELRAQCRKRGIKYAGLLKADLERLCAAPPEAAHKKHAPAGPAVRRLPLPPGVGGLVEAGLTPQEQAMFAAASKQGRALQTEMETKCARHYSNCGNIVDRTAPKDVVDLCRPRCLVRCQRAIRQLLTATSKIDKLRPLNEEHIEYLSISIMPVHGQEGKTLKIGIHWSKSGQDAIDARMKVREEKQEAKEEKEGPFYLLPVAKRMLAQFPSLQAGKVYGSHFLQLEARQLSTAEIVEHLCRLIWHYGGGGATESIVDPNEVEKVITIWKTLREIQPHAPFEAIVLKERHWSRPDTIAAAIAKLRELKVPFRTEA